MSRQVATPARAFSICGRTHLLCGHVSASGAIGGRWLLRGCRSRVSGRRSGSDVAGGRLRLRARGALCSYDRARGHPVTFVIRQGARGRAAILRAMSHPRIGPVCCWPILLRGLPSASAMCIALGSCFRCWAESAVSLNAHDTAGSGVMRRRPKSAATPIGQRFWRLRLPRLLHAVRHLSPVRRREDSRGPICRNEREQGNEQLKGGDHARDGCAAQHTARTASGGEVATPDPTPSRWPSVASRPSLRTWRQPRWTRPVAIRRSTTGILSRPG